MDEAAGEPSHMIVDHSAGDILAKLDHHGLAARLENPPHFLERSHGAAEVLECGTTDDEVERIALEGHAGDVSLAEVDADGFSGRVLARDSHEGLADVETRDLVIPESGQIDREIA